jgi:hypothetical protein
VFELRALIDTNAKMLEEIACRENDMPRFFVTKNINCRLHI